MLLFRLLLSFMTVLHSSSENNVVPRAFSPGDIMIGGLFPIHLKINRSEKPEDFVCTDYDFQMFLRSQVMIYAIEEINQHMPRLLPNLTLGYDIYDTCGDVSLAIRATLQMIKNQSDPQSCLVPESINASLPKRQTKAVIGELYSEVSTVVARILALSSVTQISYGSTSAVLSKKLKYPTFFRTVPSDEIQTKAIYKLVKEFNWKTVAIVGSDDEYGTYGSHQLQSIFGENKICVDFVEILSVDFIQNPNYTQKTVTYLIEKINTSTAEAIILFTADVNVKPILDEIIKNNLNRTWIASDAWATSSIISTMAGIEKIGQVFGFIYDRNEVPGFRDYVHSMFNGTVNNILKYHLSHYRCCSNSTGNTSCSYSMNCSDPKCLASFVDQDESYSIYLAVQVIAEGLRRVLRCDDHSCERTEFTAIELLQETMKTNITVDTTNLYFQNGDPTLGYDIVYWNKSVSSQGVDIQTLGEYYPNDTITLPEDLRKTMNSINVTVFNCSKTCTMGQMLTKRSVNTPCCLWCVKCDSGRFSPGNGTVCKACSDLEYSSQFQDQCLSKTDDFFQWTDPVSILLSSFAALAIIISIVFAIVIKLNCCTPVVKSVGGYLCFLELCSLLFNFCLIFTFSGKPTNKSCVGIPLFGFGFAICMSCILANLLQILLGFNFNLRVKTWIRKFYHPVVVVVALSGIQFALSLSWLISFPPLVDEEGKPTLILHQCTMGDQRFFIATVAYNAFLGFICFIFAFKGKQLPDLYKNASLITVSMVLFLIIWIIFLPLFLTLDGKYKPAVSGAAILISSYSILGCHLAPKCFIMVFRKELNNESAITEYIRKHYERKGLAVIK